MIKFTSSLSRAAMVTALVGSFAVAACSDFTQDNAPNGAPPPAATQQTTQTQQGWQQQHADNNGASREWKGKKAVEARIKTLHDKLMVTADQEDTWNNVAETMRENEANLDQLVEARHANPSSMTAVEDLQSYQQITQARADGMQKMVTAFSSLYDQMSPEQQKNADEVFGRFEGHRGHMAGKHHHHKKNS